MKTQQNTAVNPVYKGKRMKMMACEQAGINPFARVAHF